MMRVYQEELAPYQGQAYWIKRQRLDNPKGNEFSKNMPSLAREKGVLARASSLHQERRVC